MSRPRSVRTRTPRFFTNGCPTLQEMSGRHHEMARMMLLGWGNDEIALAMGLDKTRVSQVRNSPVMMRHLAMLSTARDSEAVTVGKLLEEDAVKNVRLLQDIRDGEVPGADVKLRSEVARDLLDRAGHGKITKVQGRLEHGHFIEGVLERVKARRTSSLSLEESITFEDAQFEDVEVEEKVA